MGVLALGFPPFEGHEEGTVPRREAPQEGCAQGSRQGMHTHMKTDTPNTSGRRNRRIATGVAFAAAGALVIGMSQQAAPSEAATDTATAMPQGDLYSNGRTWKQSYAEDFTRDAPLGSVLDEYPEMGAYSGYSDTSGRGWYDPDRVLSVEDGNLDFWLHSEDGQPLVATVLPDGYAPHDTGRVSIRYKTTDTPGYKFVGMLWPVDDDWNKGEIDWPEGDLGSTVRPASAIPGTWTENGMRFDSSVQRHTDSEQSNGYHVATTEWDHGVVRFYWDDTLVSVTHSAVPNDPMRVTLQAETSILNDVPWWADGHVDIDWISIWD